jgi:CRISPR-associated protein (TIGR02710 family)
MLIRIKRLMDTDDEWRTRDISGWELIEDIIQAADRSASRGRYDDAIARLYRATEFLGQLQLRKRYGLHADRLSPQDERLPSTVMEWIKSYAEPSHPGKLPLFAIYTLLAAFEDPLGAFFRDRESELKGLIQFRNSSLLAHGFKPIGAETWRTVGPKWIRWIQDGWNAI